MILKNAFQAATSAVRRTPPIARLLRCCIQLDEPELVIAAVNKVTAAADEQGAQARQ